MVVESIDAVISEVEVRQAVSALQADEERRREVVVSEIQARQVPAVLDDAPRFVEAQTVDAKVELGQTVNALVRTEAHSNWNMSKVTRNVENGQSKTES